MTKQETKPQSNYVGKYEKQDGTRFDFRYENKVGLIKLNEHEFHNRVTYPITVEELEKELEEGKIKKL